MDNKELAVYIERHVVPDMVARHPENKTPMGFWIATLNATEKLPDHEWNNLLTILMGWAILTGQTYEPAVTYCRSQLTSKACKRHLDMYLDPAFFEECRQTDYQYPS